MIGGCLGFAALLATHDLHAQAKKSPAAAGASKRPKIYLYFPVAAHAARLTLAC